MRSLRPDRTPLRPRALVQMKPKEKELELLCWFEAELKAQLNNPNRIVTEACAVEFEDVARKAIGLGLKDFEHGFHGRNRWEEIGGYALGARIIRRWRKTNGVKSPPRNP